MKKNILITSHLLEDGIQDLQKEFNIIMPEKGDFSREEMLAHLPYADALIAAFSYPIHKEEIEIAKRLKIISSYGVGFNHIDIKTAKEKGIFVCNTPNAVLEPTAELAIALMHAVARRICECDKNIKNKTIQWGMLKNLGISLYGKTLGIIGLGRIGNAVAKRASVCGMNIIYHNRKPIENCPYEYKSLNDLLTESDVISINTPLSSETHHLLNRENLSLMKPTSILINTARGAIINEKDLVCALKNKQIWGAGLDVYEDEPFINPQLLELNNVVLVPHIGTETTEARNAISQECSNNIISFFNGQKINSVV